MSLVPDPIAGQPATSLRRLPNLALLYEDVFTVIVRLRSNRQAVANAEAFRANIVAVLKKVEQEAIQRGYSSEDVGLASFAVVAFLDETILSSLNPAFSDWERQPLQVQLRLIRGGHLAGEVFFQYVERLLTLRETQELADLLEVYYLCLLLGYKGRYSLSEPAALYGIRDVIGEKLRQIRGPAQPLSPTWAPGAGVAPRARDPWIKRLLYSSAACLLLALALFILFKLVLRVGISSLAEALVR